MNPVRYGRLAPLIILFAWLQALAPAVAAIADARLLDDRTPYAHVVTRRVTPPRHPAA
jgi:hypothetical protein